MFKQITFVLLAAVGLASCGGNKTENGQTAEISGTISIDGSSTVFPLSEAMAEEFGLKTQKPELQWANQEPVVVSKIWSR